jgi:hypothetical protein
MRLLLVSGAGQLLLKREEVTWLRKSFRMK